MGGLHEAFDFAVAACLVAAVASWLRGGKFHYEDRLPSPAAVAEPINGQAATPQLAGDKSSNQSTSDSPSPGPGG
ncbi:MAG TPA: hypothetical protein VMV23_08035 [Candidatus Nanopelagicaceae bacterium]|nr:hypothetical protein [Candidatus Nanopelagicaceae bacterium]